MSALVLSLILLGSDPNANDRALIEAGRNIGVQSILTGEVHPTLQKLAQDQANFCAKHQIQGHQLWNSQFQAYYRQFPGLRSIVAESWPWQRDIREAAPECFDSWKHSPGHWAHCNRACRHYGLAIAQGANGIWYGCGIFAD